MAAGFHALSDHGVGTGGMSGPGFGHRAALVGPRAVGEPARPAPKRHHDVRLPDRISVGGPHEGQQQVDGNRFARSLTRCA